MHVQSCCFAYLNLLLFSVLVAFAVVVDLLQVDLLESGASLVWTRSGRPRATKSREVDLSRLMGSICISRQKWGAA